MRLDQLAGFQDHLYDMSNEYVKLKDRINFLDQAFFLFQHALQVCWKFLAELNTMTVEKNVEVNANDEAIEFLIKKGFNEKLGARPLQRVIDEDIKKPLSKMILFGELTTGGMVEVSLSDDVVPKLKINFKAAEVLKVKAKKENEKTPQ